MALLKLTAVILAVAQVCVAGPCGCPCSPPPSCGCSSPSYSYTPSAPSCGCSSPAPISVVQQPPQYSCGQAPQISYNFQTVPSGTCSCQQSCPAPSENIIPVSYSLKPSGVRKVVSQPSCGCGYSAPAPAPSCGCGYSAPAPAPSCGCGYSAPAPSCGCSAPVQQCQCQDVCPQPITICTQPRYQQLEYVTQEPLIEEEIYIKQKPASRNVVIQEEFTVPITKELRESQLVIEQPSCVTYTPKVNYAPQVSYTSNVEYCPSTPFCQPIQQQQQCSCCCC